jgi:N-acetylmuramoyl-L-alanine amidase
LAKRPSWLILMTGLIAICLVLLAGAGARAEDGGLRVTLDGKALDPEISVRLGENGVRFINLPFLNQYLHINSDWDPDKGEIYLRFGKLTLLLFEDDPQYSVNGETRRLAAAPFEAENQLWVPLEFIEHLGLAVKSQDERSVALAWSASFLLGLERVQYQDRPAFMLLGTKPLTIKSFLLTGPDRLVVDLPGVQAHPAFDSAVAENPMVKRVRFSPNGDGLRVVFDLNRLSGYQIIQEPGSNQATIVLNYLVEAIDFFQNGPERKVYIKSNYPARYQVSTFDHPSRLVVDLAGATLVGNNRPIPGDGRWIKAVRMSQFNSDTVRVVLDLVTPTHCFVIRSRTHPNWLEIRTVQNITAVSWSEEKDGGRLTITGDGELVEAIRKLKDPQRLQVDLNFSRPAADLKLPAIQNEQVKGVKLIPLNATALRLEISLNYFVGYQPRFSADRRQLAISFRRSPVIGKTVVLDPGHGGVDSGASGRQGTREKDVVLEVGLRLRELLEDAGAHVVMTRSDDTFISLYERPFLANYLFSDLFISIHANSSPNFQAQGVEVYHYAGRSDSQHLAKSVLDNLVRGTQLNNLGVKFNDFIVIREAQMPGILIELGFLSNFQEETTLRSSEYKEKAAAAILAGIVDYYQKS